MAALPANAKPVVPVPDDRAVFGYKISKKMSNIVGFGTKLMVYTDCLISFNSCGHGGN